jgi:hypothetical protein
MENIQELFIPEHPQVYAYASLTPLQHALRLCSGVFIFFAQLSGVEVVFC